MSASLSMCSAQNIVTYNRQIGQGPLTRFQFNQTMISTNQQQLSPQNVQFGIACTEEPEPMEGVEEYQQPAAVGGATKQSLVVRTLSKEEDNCVICMDDITNKMVLDKCSHAFCKDCIELQFKYKSACPVCGTVYGVVKGNQPNGTIRICKVKGTYQLEGYEGHGVISVSYSFPDGTQTAEHYNPGQRYYGTSRTGFFPDNPEGIKIVKMLKVAFDRRLLFTVGRSRTTGSENVVTWNDVHHKTSMTGGPQNFGYPDPTYLIRVEQELAAKGVTEEDTCGVKLNFS